MSGNYFSKKEIKQTLVLSIAMIINHLVWAFVWKIGYLSIVWWLCIPYVFLDASTEGYEEEEGDYEEEEEYFDNCTNQGKLY